MQDTWKANVAPDARLRRALPLVHAVVLDAACGRLRARALRSGEGAAALSAGADQQRQRRLRSGDGRDAPQRLRRHLRAGHRRSLQRHGAATPIPNYPKGFRDNQGIEPEPRLGLAWDLTGDAKTAMHASVGLYHNPHVNANGLDAMARNPPAQNTPSIIYGTMDTLLAAGAQGAFSNRPSDVFGIERDAKTPKSYNYSVGVQREIGWGTVHRRDLRRVPDAQRRDGDEHQHGAGWRAVRRRQSAERQSAEPDHGQSRTSSCDRISATRTSRIREHFGRRPTTRCRCSSTVATSTACSSRSRTPTGRPSPTARPVIPPPTTPSGPATHGTRGPVSSTQLHALVVNYTWDVPNGSSMWNNWLTRGLLDGWQLSGDTAWVSGDWSGATTSTTDNFDFTGGDGGTRPDISGDTLCTSGNCDPTPGGTGSYFNVSAFSRLTGRGDIGNAPVTFFRLPKIVLSNMSIFKNFQLGGEQADSVPVGGLQRVQPGELVDTQHQRAVQSRGRTGQRELRPGARPRDARVSCRERFGSRSEPRITQTGQPNRPRTTRTTSTGRTSWELNPWCPSCSSFH